MFIFYYAFYKDPIITLLLISTTLRHIFVYIIVYIHKITILLLVIFFNVKKYFFIEFCGFAELIQPCLLILKSLHV